MPAEYISCLPNPYCRGSFFQYQLRKARQDSTDCHGLFPTPAPLSLPAGSWVIGDNLTRQLYVLHAGNIPQTSGTSYWRSLLYVGVCHEGPLAVSS